MSNNKVLSLLFNNFEFRDFKYLKKSYEFAKSIYNHEELNRRSGLPYITHIDDILFLSIEKYKVIDKSITNILIFHDIFEENYSLLKKLE